MGKNILMSLLIVVVLVSACIEEEGSTTITETTTVTKTETLTTTTTKTITTTGYSNTTTSMIETTTTTTTTMEKSDALKAYLQSKGWSSEYDLFKPMLRDNQLGNIEKQLIDYFNSLPDDYQKNSKVLEIVNSIVIDGEVTESELKDFRDWDGDGLSNLEEVNKYNMDPLQPTPVLVYLIQKNESDEYQLFRNFDSDDIMQSLEKQLIDYFNSLPKKYKENQNVLELLSKIVKDGKVTENEWNTFQDWDNDGISNLFEIYYFTLADPLIRNDRYVIIFTAHRPGLVKPPSQEHYYEEGARECAQRFEGNRTYSFKKVVNSLYNFFVNDEKIPAENFYLYIGKNATIDNLEKVLKEISEKSDENDFIYLFLTAHGNEKGEIWFFEEVDNGLKLTDVKYSTIGKWLDNIESRYQIVAIDACGSGSAIDALKDEHRIILTSVNYEIARTLPYLHLLVGMSLSEWYPESYISIRKLYEDARGFNKCMCEEMRNHLREESNPQIFDANNVSDKIYIGEYVRSDNNTCTRFGDFPLLVFVDAEDLTKEIHFTSAVVSVDELSVSSSSSFSTTLVYSVSIWIQNNRSEEIQVRKVSLHFDWMPNDQMFSHEFEPPKTLESGDKASLGRFSTIPIPKSVYGLHSYYIYIETWGPANGVKVWKFGPYSINITRT